MNEVQARNPNTEVAQGNRIGRLGRIACGVFALYSGIVGVGGELATVVVKMPETVIPAGVGAAGLATAVVFGYAAKNGHFPGNGEVNR